MEQARMVLSEMEVIECIAFLLTSADCLKDEPWDYGSMRLLAAANWLCEKSLPRASDDWKPLMGKLLSEIPGIQRERQRNPDKYYAFIDECCAELTKNLLSLKPDHEQQAK